MSVTSNFEVNRLSSKRDVLGKIQLRINMSQIGPRGGDLYSVWRAKGNAGTYEDFLNYSEDTVRPKFRTHEMNLGHTAVYEVPTDYEALVVAKDALAKIGDLVVYETPMSINEQTVGRVIHQWEVRENAAGTDFDVVKRPMATPVYLRKLLSTEVSPGFNYHVDQGDGMFPTHWTTNKVGSPVEVYTHPALDYSILTGAVDTIMAQVNAAIDAGITVPPELVTQINQITAMMSVDDVNYDTYQKLVTAHKALVTSNTAAFNLSASATETGVVINNPKGNNANIPLVTTTTAGLMTAAKAVYLDTVPASLTAITAASTATNARIDTTNLAVTAADSKATAAGTTAANAATAAATADGKAVTAQTAATAASTAAATADAKAVAAQTTATAAETKATSATTTAGNALPKYRGVTSALGVTLNVNSGTNNGRYLISTSPLLQAVTLPGYQADLINASANTITITSSVTMKAADGDTRIKIKPYEAVTVISIAVDTWLVIGGSA